MSQDFAPGAVPLLRDLRDLGALEARAGEKAGLADEDDVDAVLRGRGRQLSGDALVGDRDVRPDPDLPALGFLDEAHDLITGPTFIVIKAADEFRDKTTAPNQLWQTDFTYLKVIGWGWFYLSTILDDYSRYIVAWKLCANMKAGDVTDTLELALEASGCDRATVRHKPRLLSDNGSSYISHDLAEWLYCLAWAYIQVLQYVREREIHIRRRSRIERFNHSFDPRHPSVGRNSKRPLFGHCVRRKAKTQHKYRYTQRPRRAPENDLDRLFHALSFRSVIGQ